MARQTVATGSGGAITDKGYVNQRAVLERRHTLVEHLIADPPPSDAILP